MSGSILLGILGLGIVVFIHELGHLLGAKAVGIEVEAFSLGWGKKLISRTWRGTEYRLSLLPLGGYCKMKGEKMLQGALEKGEDTIPKEPGTLFGVSPIRRIFTYLAGPFGNFFFAIFLFALVWQIGFTIYTYPNRVVLTDYYPLLSAAGPSPARRGGIESGDRIVEVEGRKVEHFDDLREVLSANPEDTLDVVVQRDGAELTFQITPEKDASTGMGKIGVSAWIDPVVDQVVPGSAADIGGIKTGDLLVSANERPLHHQLDLMAVMQEQPDKLMVTLRRQGEPLSLTVIPHYNDQGADPLGIGFAGLTVSSPRINPVQALARGAAESVSTLILSVKSLLYLPFSDMAVGDAVSGPIRITYYVGEVASQGFSLGFRQGITSYLRFLGFISIALFFMNLLPIPLLDGGMVAANLFEMVSRKPLKPVLFYRFQMVGFFLLLMLILFTTYNDILFLFQR